MAQPSRRGRRSAVFPLIERRPLSPDWPGADWQAWTVAITPAAGPFDHPGPAAHLSASSQQIREAAYGSFLCWLEAKDLLDATALPAARVQPEWVAGWLAETCSRVSAKTADMLLVNLSLAIAAMVPEGDWRWIRKVPGRPPRKAVRAGARGKPTPPDTARLAADAIGLCVTLDNATPSIRTAVEYRNALIIALSCYHAPRLRNLAEVRLGIHLLRIADGTWRLEFRRTKNHEPFSALLGAGLVPHLERYLEIHRPHLLRGREEYDFLWINWDGLPLASTAFRGIFQVMGRKLVGYGLHPHLVRHGMATGLMQANPRSIRTAAAALGHHSTASVNQVYDRSDISVFTTEWARVLKKRLGR